MSDSFSSLVSTGTKLATTDPTIVFAPGPHSDGIVASIRVATVPSATGADVSIHWESVVDAATFALVSDATVVPGTPLVLDFASGLRLLKGDEIVAMASAGGELDVIVSVVQVHRAA